MPSKTTPHITTATCCAFASAIRGTFIARAIVANERMASSQINCVSIKKSTQQDIGLRLTYGCDDLCLHPKLHRKPTGKVANASFAITNDVWHSPDVIEHVSTCKKKDRNQAGCGPDVSVPNNWQDVWRQYSKKGYRPH